MTGPERLRRNDGERDDLTATKSISIACLALLASVQAGAAPRPDTVAKAWQLSFKFNHPEPIAVPDVDGALRWYWFMSYKVVNNTDKDRHFLPKITVASEQGDIVEANKGISPRVFKVVKATVRNQLLVDPVAVAGLLRVGQDQAKESVAIWRAFDHDVDNLFVFISGLSGEVAKVINPKTGEPVIDPESLKPVIDPRTSKPVLDPKTNGPLVEPRPLLLRKTRMIEYHFPGTSVHPQHQTFVMKSKQWVMR